MKDKDYLGSMDCNGIISYYELWLETEVVGNIIDINDDGIFDWQVN